MTSKQKPGPKPTATSGANAAMRIAKMMARAGVCSRREAERYIASGRVAVNGKVIDSPALNVTTRDKILVDGNPLPDAEPIKLWRYHKPRGLVTTANDEKDRETIFDKLPKDLPRTISIGRLDINTEGLLLLTNDGELARHIELPTTGWLRRYKVRANGEITQDKFDHLKKGITIDGIKYGPIEATVVKQQGANVWFTMGLREGKNREINRIAEHLGLAVNRLIRVSFGPFILGDLKSGEIEQIKSHVLADQLGPTLAEQFDLTPSTAQAKSKQTAQQKQRGRAPRKPGPKSTTRTAKRPAPKPGGKPARKPPRKSGR